MGLYDILQKHDLDYNKLVELINDLRGCVEFNSQQVVRQLDDLYDDTEYKRDFPPRPKRIWLLRQTQPCDGYDQFTIAAFDDEVKAVANARTLNNEYAVGAKLTDEGDFIEQDDEYCDWDNSHFYDLGYVELNKEVK